MLRLIPMTMLLIAACVACTDDISKPSTARGKIMESRAALANPSSPITVKRPRLRSDKKEIQRTTSVTPRPGDSGATKQIRATGFVSLPTGAPVAEADVVLWTSLEDKNTSIPWRRAFETKTEPDGSYKIQATVKGSYAITARLPGTAVAAPANAAGSAAEQSANTVNAVDLRLEPEAPLSGRIVSAAGNPVPGAHILARPSSRMDAVIGELNTYSQPDGTFTLSGMAEGACTIAVAAPGQPIQILEASAPDTALELRLSDKIPEVTGQLISDDSDLSRTTATITISPDTKLAGLNLTRTAVTDATGSFSFGKIPALPYKLFLSSQPPVLLSLVTENMRSGTRYVSLDVEDGLSTSAIIPVTSGKILYGRILDALTSAPISGVRLYPDTNALKEERNFVQTTATGEFQLPHVTRVASVRVKAEGYYMVSPVISNALDADFGDTVTITMAQLPWLRGTVQSDMGRAVAGARLALVRTAFADNESHDVPIGPSGEFQTQSPPGTLRLVAEAAGFAPAYSEEITLATEDINDVKLVLGRGRSVSGVVVTSTGNPVAGAVVSAYAIKPNWFRMNTYSPTTTPDLGKMLIAVHSNAEGRFNMSLLPTTTELTISAESPGAAHPALFSVTPEDDDVRDLRLVLPDTVDLLGTVLDEKGNPVSGAAITVITRGEMATYYAKTASSTSGTFVQTNVPGKTTGTLSVTKKGFADHKQELQFTDAAVSVTLQRENTIAILVRCVDAETQKPMDARVTVRDTDGSQDTVSVEPVKDSPGEYLVTSVELGRDYMIAAEADGFPPDWRLVKIREDTPPAIEMQMRRATRVTGRVVSVGGKKPVPGARIVQRTSSEPLAVTGEDGRFNFQRTDINWDYYATASGDQISAPFLPPLSAGNTVDVGDIELRSKEPVIVRVVRGSSNDPAYGVTVNISTNSLGTPGIKASGKTDRKGEFTVDIFSDHNISVTLPEWRINTYEKGRAASRQPRVIIMHIGGATLRGRLLLNDKPVAGVISGKLAGANGQSARRSSGGDGKFEFNNLAPGKWSFDAGTMTTGFQRAKVAIEIPDSNEVIEQDVNLAQTAISGRVIDEAGEPVAGATVTASATDSEENSSDITDADGKFSLGGVTNGAYTVQAEDKAKGRSEFLTCTVPVTGAPPPLTLTIKAASGQIICTVLSILDGLPIKNPSAKLSWAGGSGEVTSAHSYYADELTLSHLQPGNYQLIVSAQGYSEARRVVTLEAGQTLEFTDVLSPASSLQVTLTDANGNLVPGAVVTVAPTETGSLETIRTQTTDKNGTAKFPGMLYGAYQMNATAATGASAQAAVSIRYQTEVNLRLVLDGQ